MRIAIACAGSFLGVAPLAWGQTTASWVLPVDGTWTDASKWSTNPTYPSGSFDVVLNATGGAHTVSLAQSGLSVAVNNLTLDSADVVAHHYFGTLTVNGDLNISAGQYLFGRTISGTTGTLAGATIHLSGTGSMNVLRGTFDNITLDSDLVVNNLAVRNTLTILDGHTLTANTPLQFSTSINNANLVTGSGTIALGTNVNLDNAAILDTGITVTMGGSPTVSSAITNRGVISHNGIGTLTLLAMKNEGTVQMSGGAINLRSMRYDSIGTLLRNGGPVFVTGTTGNQDLNYQLNSMTGSVRLVSGSLVGGTFSAVDGAVGTFSSFGFEGTAIDTDIWVEGSTFATIPTGGGPLTTMTAGHKMFLNGTFSLQNFSGGEIVMSPGSVIQSPGNMTIASDTLIRATGGSGSIKSSLTGSSSVRFVNNGSILVDNPGTTLEIGLNVTTFTNNGMIQAAPGSTLTIFPQWANQTGSIIVNNATLNLGSTQTGFIGNLVNNGGTVIINGGLLNTSANFVLNASTDSWYLKGSVANGTIVTQDSKSLIMLPGSQLFTAALAGHILATGSATPQRIEMFTPVMYDGSITIANEAASGSLEIYAPFGFRGNGLVSIEGSNSDTRITGGAILIEPGVTVRTTTQGATIGFSATADTLTNQGLIWHSLPGKQLALGGTWTNQGTLRLSDGTLLLGGTFTLGGGTIERSGGVVRVDGYFNNASGTMDFDTSLGSILLGAGGRLAGGVFTSNQAGVITLDSGTGSVESAVLAADVKVLGGTTLALNSATMAGSGHVIRVEGPGASRVEIRGSTDLGSLSEISLTGTSASAGVIPIGSGTFGIPATLSIYNAGGGGGTIGATARVMVNNGTVSAASAGLPLYVTGLSVDNNGLLESRNGGTLIIQRLRNNTGTIRLSNGTVQFSNAPSSVGTMDLSSSTLLINATISTAQLKAMSLANSTISIGTSGFLNNVSDSYVIDPAVALMRMNGGTISGGSLSASNGGYLDIFGGTTTLNGVQLNTPISLASATLTLLGAWSNSQTLSANNATLIIGATPGGGIGSINMGSSSLIVRSNVSSSQLNSIQRVNSSVKIENGAIVDLSSEPLMIEGALGPWTFTTAKFSDGSINSSNGGQLNFTGSLSNGTFESVTLRVPLNMSSSQSTITFGGNWRNESTITLSAGPTLKLGGSVQTADIGTIIQNSGLVILQADVDNVGSTFDLNTVGGFISVRGGTITGGTITGTGSSQFAIQGGVTLNGVALNVPASLSSAELTVLNDLGLTSTLTTSSSATLSFQGSQTLFGNGTLLVGSTGSSRTSIRSLSGGTLTIGSGVVIGTAGGGRGTLGIAGSRVVNLGSISSQSASGGLAIAGTFSNIGLVEVRNGGTISLPTTVTNYSAGSLTGGRWAVYSNSTMTMGTSTITTNNADILLDGLNSTFAPINALHTNLGSFAIDHGRNFVTAGSLTSSGFLGVGTNSTLYVSGPLNNTGSIDLIGTIIVNYDPPFGESAIFDDLVEQIGTSLFTSLVDPAKAIGSAENSALGYTTFHGFGVDATSVLLMLTYSGDANLDGVADLLDFEMYLGGLAPAETTPLWINGDFDYSGTVDLTDFELYLNGYYALGGSMSAISDAVKGASLPPETEDAMLDLVATVPEPVFAGLLGLTIPWSLKRPRRRRL